MYVLVLTGPDCEEYPGHECVIDVIEVESRAQAKEAAGKLRQEGLCAHFGATRPLTDYVEEDPF
jgi:hypothetical protein